MADIKEVLGQSTKDETAIAIPIFQRNGKLYLAADGSKATITVIGSESKTFKKARHAFVRAQAEADTDGDEGSHRAGLAALAVTDWHGWDADGKPLPCTPENVHSVLSALEHILIQVEGGIQRRTDFFPDVSGA